MYSHKLPGKDIKNIGYFTELLPIYREILKNLLIKYFFSKSLPSSCLQPTDDGPIVLNDNPLVFQEHNVGSRPRITW